MASGRHYAHTGIDRTGLAGCTAVDLFGRRIQRMSVKFDTFQMSPKQYDDVRAALNDAGGKSRNGPATERQDGRHHRLDCRHRP